MFYEVLRYFGIATMPRGDHDRHLAEMKESTDRLQEGKKILERSSRDLELVARETRTHLKSARKNKNAIDRLLQATKYAGGRQ